MDKIALSDLAIPGRSSNTVFHHPVFKVNRLPGRCSKSMPAESFSTHLAGKDSESAAKSKAHRYLPEFNFCLAVEALRTIRIPWFNIVGPLPMLLLINSKLPALISPLAYFSVASSSFTLEASIAGEIFADFVALAKEALNQKQKSAAAVLACAALWGHNLAVVAEDHVRADVPPCRINQGEG
jgi:hypothetical protein